MPTDPADDQAKLDVLNEMMHRLGGAMEGAVIEDLDASLEGVPDVRRRYDTIVGGLLSRHPWTFGTQRLQLARQDAPAGEGYPYAYTAAAPGDIQAVYADPDGQRPYYRYRKIDGKVLTDLTAAWAEVRVGASPHAWPPYFRQLVVAAGAAEFAVPVTNDRLLARELRQEAFGLPGEDPNGGLMREAKRLDGQQQGSGRLTFGWDPLTAARFR